MRWVLTKSEIIRRTINLIYGSKMYQDHVKKLRHKQTIEINNLIDTFRKTHECYVRNKIKSNERLKIRRREERRIAREQRNGIVDRLN
jgi:hypothetical protein